MMLVGVHSGFCHAQWDPAPPVGAGEKWWIIGAPLGHQRGAALSGQRDVRQAGRAGAKGGARPMRGESGQAIRCDLALYARSFWC